ncbi:MAG TPA: cytochrome c oxidase subunit 3 [Bryobacteraceae bacterium]|nr:cytochrome c oxidase subunit 3 [Bryobacteraceae bacterium]
MSRLLSDRAEKTANVVLLQASLEDPKKAPPGLYRIGLLATCGSIFAFFTALIVAYCWRAGTPPYWDRIPLPPTLWLSTGLILAASGSFEAARRVFGKGNRHLALRFLIIAGLLGLGFLGSQFTAWRELVEYGAFLSQNPHSSFFYLFTGLHAIHLLGGLAALMVVMIRRSPRRELVDVVAYYWHFLAILWIALFATLSLVS